jgi:hypothetical protein
MWLGAAGYAAVVVVALVRVVFRHRRWEDAVRAAMAREREIHSQGRKVRLAGAPREVIEIGRGRELDLAEASLAASGFDLIAEDGTLIHVARGHKLETRATGILRLDEATDVYTALAGDELLLYDDGDAGIMLTDRKWPWSGTIYGVRDLSPKLVAVVVAIYAAVVGVAVWRESLGWSIAALVLLVPLVWDQIRRGGQGLFAVCGGTSRIWARLEAE